MNEDTKKEVIWMMTICVIVISLCCTVVAGCRECEETNRVHAVIEHLEKVKE